jgi:hypothetical protein
MSSKFSYDYDAEYKRRPVRSSSKHAIIRYGDVDPGAGYFAVLSECERGRMLDPGLAAAVLGRGPDHHVLYDTPDDGFVLHRYGLVLFACSQHRANPDALFCVTAIRLGDAQRKVLRGLFEELPGGYGFVTDDEEGDRGQDRPSAHDSLAAYRPETAPLCPIANGGVLAGKMSDKMVVDMCETLLPAARERMAKGQSGFVNMWLTDANTAERCLAGSADVLIRPASGVDTADLRRRFREAYAYGEAELRAHVKKVQNTLKGLRKVSDG